ncbi:MAG TPA: permease prefix domain 1-containing protein, partial [Micromonosporaceae bacterium]
MADDTSLLIEEQIGQWRGYAQDHRQLHPGDLDELEDHLRATIAELTALGLREDEAFLVAVKRMGSLNELSREFSRTHSERLWKQLVLTADSPAEAADRRTFTGMIVFAVLAAVAIKVPALFGASAEFYARNLPLFAFTPLVAYFAWRHRTRVNAIAVPVGFLALGAIAINAYPFRSGSDTLLLAALHLTLALWFVVGLAYVQLDWRNRQRWMDFIRFTGEAIIYIALIAIGGGVLVGIVGGTFSAVHIRPDTAIREWIVPCGGMGAL